MKFYRSEERLIHQFRGLRDVRDRSRQDGSRLIGECLPKILNRIEVRPDSPEQTLMNHWREVMGPDLSDRSAPERLLEDGTLFIRVANPMIRQEIRFGQRTVLRKIRSLPGCEGVVRIVVR